MRSLFLSILISNICFGQFKYEWTKQIKTDSVATDVPILYYYTNEKIFLLTAHDFYETKIKNNDDGSISMNFGKKNSSDSFQKASIYELDAQNYLREKKRFSFSPGFEIKQFIVPAKDRFLVYGAERYILGKGQSFIKEWGEGSFFSEFAFNAQSSSLTRLVFMNKNDVGIIGFQYGRPVDHPVFSTVDLKKRKTISYFPDSVRLDYFFQCAYSDEKFYTAGNCRLHTDSADKSPLYARLLVFDTKGRLDESQVFQLDDSAHYFDVRSLSVFNDEVAITGLLYFRDHKNRGRSWVVETIKKGERQWVRDLPANYMPQSVHQTPKGTIVVALFGQVSGRRYKNYHLLRYNSKGDLVEDMVLENMKPEWKNIQVFYEEDDFLVFAGKNIFDSIVIEKISF